MKLWNYIQSGGFAIVLGAMVLLAESARCEELQQEFVMTDKLLTDFIAEGYDIKGTWGPHVLVLQKGTEVAFCEIVAEDNLYVTRPHGCEVRNPRFKRR